MESDQCLLLDLGFARDYKAVLKLQRKLVDFRATRRAPDALIVVEHDHVLTLGRSSHLENVLSRDLPIFEIERGGDVTYHGPGQLVAYPILSLAERGLGVRQYVQHLETAIISTLNSLSIRNADGKLGRETGVWIDNKRKIASIGVAVSHWVTYHGLALNVSTDLSYFAKINPCGFESSVMTSIAKETGNDGIHLSKVKEFLLASLSNEFNWNYEISERKNRDEL
jgi:lipoate-protein ligase B